MKIYKQKYILLLIIYIQMNEYDLLLNVYSITAKQMIAKFTKYVRNSD